MGSRSKSPATRATSPGRQWKRAPKPETVSFTRALEEAVSERRSDVQKAYDAADQALASGTFDSLGGADQKKHLDAFFEPARLRNRARRRPVKAYVPAVRVARKRVFERREAALARRTLTAALVSA